MLYLAAIDTPTLGLLNKLMHHPMLNTFRLVGGTALALQIGHRKSVDLDFFGNYDIEMLEFNLLLNEFLTVTSLKRSEKINIFSINDIKVDFVNYKYPWLCDAVYHDEIRLAGLEDIAAMKLAAITGRGSKKDFIDLYFLLEKFTLQQMLGFYEQKYADASSYMLLKSLTYFEDAEAEPQPEMLFDVSWQQIKHFLCEAVESYARSLQ
jgi:hypothetical protein